MCTAEPGPVTPTLPGQLRADRPFHRGYLAQPGPAWVWTASQDALLLKAAPVVSLTAAWGPRVEHAHGTARQGILFSKQK